MASCERHLVMNRHLEIVALIREELAHSDSVLMPENTLLLLLGISRDELPEVASSLAEKNDWTVMQTKDRCWHFQAKAA